MYGSAVPSFQVIVSDPFSPCLFDKYKNKYRIRSKFKYESDDEVSRLVYVPAVNIKGDPFA